MTTTMQTGQARGFNEREIFDAVDFERRLAVAGQQPLPLFRETLKRGDQILQKLFLDNVPAEELVSTRAWLLDQLLVRIWRWLFCMEGSELALVAVGGYGRGELHPGSDVDILLLISDAGVGEHKEALERFLMLLWDIGLEVGHSVRTVADCAREAKADVTVITNLMEARLLAGSDQLFQRMQNAIAPDQIWPSRAFFEAKQEEQRRRYHKFHDTAYNLEPNVKEGPGGLRDLQTVAWVAKRHFAVTTLHDLVEREFLTEQEYADLIACQNFLWRVRFALHMITGRREDRLLFDYQRELAQMFGCHNESHNLAIEEFMQRYYRTIMELSCLNEMLLQLFEEAILLADDPGEPVSINRRFQARKGYIEAMNEQVFKRYPFALLEVFLLLQQNANLKGIRATTVRLIRNNLHLIDQRFRDDVRAQSLFMEILRQPRCVTRQLRQMNRYGVLPAYLPEFGKIVGRMQYDLFHVYTVDQHTLFVVRNLRRFYIPKYVHEFPRCSELMHMIPKPELLYIAALYHDIAKGRSGDHSELGAQDIERFGRRHGLSDFDIRLVSWLVRNHLFMSLTAQKKDIYDPDVVKVFAEQVSDIMHLNYLYLLTVADIRATNPKLWNTWREKLLRELYETTRHNLQRGLDNSIDRAELIASVQQHAQSKLEATGIEEPRFAEIWEGFNDDYFLRHSADEIVWHTRAILKKADDGRSLVMAREDGLRGGTEIFIYTRDRPNLFALTTSVLDQLGLNILDARIITSPSGYTLDSYTVLEADGKPIRERARTKEIVLRLRRKLNHPDADPVVINRRTSRVLKHFQNPTQVSFIDDLANQRTILELVTSDRPGLLCCVGRAFMDCGIQLQNAKIATIGAQVEDIFYITDESGMRLRDPQRFVELREALVRNLDGDGPC